MNKITILICITLSLGSVTVNAQSLAINTTGAAANGTSILDVSSSAKGVLVPRMSSVQRAGIGTPANGLLVYDTDSIAFSYFNGVNWIFIKTGKDTASAWSTNGNAGITNSNFLGTTDNANIIFKRNNIRAGIITSTSTAFGVESMNAAANSFNTAVGYKNMFNSISGLHNIAVGDSNLYYGSSGNNNIAIGSRNIPYVTGSNNIGIGSFNFNRDLYNGQNFRNNIAIGTSAQNQQWHGFENIALGTNALYNDTTGNNNTAIGYHTLEGNLSGYNNIALGKNALNSNKTGYNNVAIGVNALFNNTDRNNLVAIGDSALYNNGIGAALGSFEARFNTAIGNKTLFANTTGSGNTANGDRALNGNTTGGSNTANGVFALLTNTTGSSNVAVGISALQGNSVGSENTALGTATLMQSNNGSFNVAVGANALSRNQNGNRNVAVGVSAGDNIFNNSGNYNTYIGDSTMMLDNRTNSTVIGSKAYTSTNNSMVLGSINGINGATADVKVGIGVTNPSEKLEIGNGRLRFKGNAPGGNAHGITWTNNAGDNRQGFYRYGNR